MARTSGVSVSQIARELGINPNMLSRWCREAETSGTKAFQGQGKTRDEDLSALKRELARVKKERVFYKKRRRSSRKRRNEVPYDRTLPRCVPGSNDVSLS